ncbi:MAG: 16S rRNA (cytosine(1402)-N(4))-methyltransferase RsmH [Gemmatimonadota bacterium]
MAKDFHHQPVLVREVVNLMEPAGRGEIMDGTAGGGGHTLALLERYPECRILAVDRDPEALAAARVNVGRHEGRVRFFEGGFEEAARSAADEGPKLAGALLDLGVSAHQLDRDARGFTFRPEAPLDMRMTGAKGAGPTAADVLNGWEEEELRRIFREYGEEPQARRLAKAVTLLRGDRPFRVAADFIEAMEKAFRRPPTIKEKARCFMSLRLEVNREIEVLEAALPALKEALCPGGILAVISYHSLEDRRVKQAFQSWSQGCVCPPKLPVCLCGGKASGTLITRRVVRPDEDEVEANPRARSARLRAWRKAA